MQQALIAVALSMAPIAATAEVVDIRWSAEGRFVHEASVAPGGFVELCGKLPAGLKVRWDFVAGAPLDFNVHYHLGKDVVFPVRLSAVAQSGDILHTEVEQDYCWMWSNALAAPTTLSVTLQR